MPEMLSDRCAQFALLLLDQLPNRLDPVVFAGRNRDDQRMLVQLAVRRNRHLEGSAYLR